MNKYIDSDKLIAEIERLKERYGSIRTKSVTAQNYQEGRLIGYEDALYEIKKALQQEKLLAVVPGFLDRNFHEEIRFSTENDTFCGDTAFVLPEDSVSFEDLIYETIKVELLIKKA